MKLSYVSAFLWVLSSAQDAVGQAAALTGFPGEATANERALEERFVSSLNAANLRAWLEELTARPHHTGSPGGRRVAEARAALEAARVSLDPADLAGLNAIIRRAEQQLAPATGLPGRPWYRHLVYAPGYDTGYSVKTLPGVREAVERGDWEQARSETERLAAAIENYAAKIDKATEIQGRATAANDRRQ